MSRPGPMSPKSSAYALSAAALFDMSVLGLVASIITDRTAPDLRQLLPSVPPMFLAVVVFAMLLGLYWIVTEGLLRGRTMGRAILGLSLCAPGGEDLPATKCAARAMRKFSTLGLTGVNPTKPAGYDVATGAVWYSPLASAPVLSVENWRIQFTSGPSDLNGRVFVLKDLLAKSGTGDIRFGRDATWTRFTLDKAGQYGVSAQHCFLTLSGGTLKLRDGNGAGKPSSNGTFVDGQKLKANESVALQGGQVVQMGQVAFRILS